jgi:hypothetical protein
MKHPIRLLYKYQQGKWQPIIPIGIRFGDEWERLDVYVDSGAAYSILHSYIADQVGFDYRLGQRIALQVGDGRLIRVFLHELEIQLGTERFTLPMGFSDQLGVRVNVLGEAGIFDRFKICFHASERSLYFEC